MPNPHPEVVIGIPALVVFAKRMEDKQAAAELAGYKGPLTLEEAVRQGKVSADGALAAIEHWYEGGGVGRGEKLAWTTKIRAIADAQTSQEPPVTPPDDP